MNVGQVMINPAIVGAALGTSIGAVQKYGHDSDTSVVDTAVKGGELGLGLGALFVGAKVAFASKKVGRLTNPFSTSKVDTTGMSADAIKALKSWGLV